MSTLFTIEERNFLHKQFWVLMRDSQKIGLLNAVQETQVSTKIKGSKRKYSRIYIFQKKNSENTIKKIQVYQH